MMKLANIAAAGLTAFVLLSSGCSTPQQRMDTAASRDAQRRAHFERCRNEGRTDCDAILNEPVDSTQSADSIKERERRASYNRCVAEGGNDCEDLLRH
jgi:hypothetical protein